MINIEGIGAMPLFAPTYRCCSQKFKLGKASIARQLAVAYSENFLLKSYENVPLRTILTFVS